MRTYVFSPQFWNNFNYNYNTGPIIDWFPFSYLYFLSTKKKSIHYEDRHRVDRSAFFLIAQKFIVKNISTTHFFMEWKGSSTLRANKIEGKLILCVCLGKMKSSHAVHLAHKCAVPFLYINRFSLFYRLCVKIYLFVFFILKQFAP